MGRDERNSTGRKTQEAFMGRETVKQMTIQRPVLLPQNRQQNSADPGAISVQVSEKDRACTPRRPPRYPTQGFIQSGHSINVLIIEFFFFFSKQIPA